MTSSDLLNLKKYGFVNANSLKLSSNDVSRLRYLCRAQYSLEKQKALNLNQSADRNVKTANPFGLSRLPEHHPEIAQILNQLLKNSLVKYLLETILGPNYKIWQITYRRSEPGDRGLFLHQDGVGETNISILLSDNHSVNGSTAFLPCSHHLPRLLQTLNLSVPPELITYLSPLFLQHLNGYAGDIGLFFNKTWHCRHCNSSNQIYDVILISLFPEGSLFGPIPEGDNWCPKFLESIAGTPLEARLNLKLHTSLVSGNRIFILNTNESYTPLSMHFEKKRIRSLNPLNFRILCFIGILLITSLARRIVNMTKSIGIYINTYDK